MSTTIDTPVSHVGTPPAPDAGTSARGAAGSSSRGGVARRVLGDLAALVPLVVLLPVLASSDGGRGLAGTWPLALAAAVALPVALAEIRRLPRVAVGLLATWTLALVVGVGASRYRADMVLPLLQYAVAPIVLLATRRVWRRPWGPGVLLALLGIAFARYQVRSWLDWWAQTEGGTGYWRPLSWRNPSAALMGMLGAWFLGIALMSGRLVRVGFGLLAATAFTGAWLSSSRAGLAVTVAAAVVVVVLALRAARVHGASVLAPAVATVVVALATAGIVAALVSMQPSGTAQALASRDQGVGQNTLARIEHSEAALGMFFDRPLAGQGLGSYKRLAAQWNDPEGNLTSSAHNEYVEVAGETGVLGVTALLGVLAGLAWLGMGQLRRPPRPGSLSDLRPGMAVGATGATALFLVHTAVDFDWYYPVLSGMAAIGAAIVIPQDVTRRASRTTTVTTAFLLTALLAGGLSFAAVERADVRAPWQERSRLASGLAALDDGRPAAALDAANASLRWNPGSPAARSLRSLAQYELDGDVGALEASLAAQPTWFDGRARAAMALASDGATDTARQILAELHDDLDRHAAWGVTSSRLRAVEAEVVLAAETSCDDAQAVVTDWTRDDDRAHLLPTTAAGVLRERLDALGCG